MRRRGKRIWLGLVGSLVAAGLLSASCQGSSSSGGRNDPSTVSKISEVIPESGDAAGGDTVTIITSGFEDDFTVSPPRVFFDTAEAISVAALDASSLEVVTPPDPSPDPSGSRDVTVRVESASWGQVATLELGFLYSAPPTAPCFTIVPDVGQVSGGSMVILESSGSSCSWGTVPSPTVTFDGVPAIVVMVTSNQITCTVPAASQAGPVDVEVLPTFDPSGNPCPCILADGFTYQ